MKILEDEKEDNTEEKYILDESIERAILLISKEMCLKDGDVEETLEILNEILNDE